MNAALVILVLSNAGHWLSDQPAEVEIHWAAQQQMPAAVVQWELQFGQVVLAQGETQMPAAAPARVGLQVPPVRVRSRLAWSWTLRQAEDRRLLGRGSAEVVVYPPDLLDDLSRHYVGRRLILLGDDPGLAELLQRAQLNAGGAQDLKSAALDRPDMLIIAPDALEELPLAQAPLESLAQDGTQVAILQQSRLARLAGYPIRRRDFLDDIDWRLDHPLLSGFDRIMLDSLLRRHRALDAIQLPAEEAALEIAYWPPEAQGAVPAAIDALVVTRTIGAVGRIVFVQLPLGDWESDPRSQIFMNNLLNYLSTRPQPTPPPSRRIAPQPAAPATVPVVQIPPGDRR